MLRLVVSILLLVVVFGQPGPKDKRQPKWVNSCVKEAALYCNATLSSQPPPKPHLVGQQQAFSSPPPQGSNSPPPPQGSNSPPPPQGSNSPPPKGSGSPPPQGSGSPPPQGSGSPPPQGSGSPPPQGSNSPPPPQGSGSPPPPQRSNSPPPTSEGKDSQMVPVLICLQSNIQNIEGECRADLLEEQKRNPIFSCAKELNQTCSNSPTLVSNSKCIISRVDQVNVTRACKEFVASVPAYVCKSDEAKFCSGSSTPAACMIQQKKNLSPPCKQAIDTIVIAEDVQGLTPSQVADRQEARYYGVTLDESKSDSTPTGAPMSAGGVVAVVLFVVLFIAAVVYFAYRKHKVRKGRHEFELPETNENTTKQVY